MLSVLTLLLACGGPAILDQPSHAPDPWPMPKAVVATTERAAQDAALAAEEQAAQDAALAAEEQASVDGDEAASSEEPDAGAEVTAPAAPAPGEGSPPSPP